MAVFRRQPQPTAGSVPRLPPGEQRRLIRESDRQNYTSHGYRALTNYAFAKDIVAGRLWGLIHDQLTDRDPPERSAVLVGVHDVDLERGVAAVLGAEYSKSGVTLGQFLPVAGDQSLEGRQLRAVLLFSDDGEQAERHRVERVVALAQEYADQHPTVQALRRQVVDQLIREQLAKGHRVRLALAAAWSGQEEIADRVTREFPAGLPAASLELLHGARVAPPLTPVRGRREGAG